MKSDWRDWRTNRARAGPGLFPPDLVVQVKALACELPVKYGLPLSRWSVADLGQQVRRSGIVASISDITVWRWLHKDAIRPWYHRSWIFPRDPNFAVKAGRILDLYERVGDEKPLKIDEFVLSAVAFLGPNGSGKSTLIKAITRECYPRHSSNGVPLRVLGRDTWNVFELVRFWESSPTN